MSADGVCAYTEPVPRSCKPPFRVSRLVASLAITTCFTTCGVLPNFGSAKELLPSARKVLLNEFLPGLIELTLNGVHRGDTLVIVDQESYRIWIAQSEIARLRIDENSLRVIGTHGGQPFFLLPRLASTEFKYDATRQTADLSIDPRMFLGTQRIGRTQSSQGRLPNADFSASANYDVRIENVDGQSAASALLELRATTSLGRASSAVTVAAANDSAVTSGTKKVRRLNTVFEREFPNAMTYVRLGDFVTRNQGLSPSVRLGGIQYATDEIAFTDPFRFPMASIAGAAALPSTAEIFVNGVTLATHSIEPGLFSITDVPILNGAGELTTRVRDASGKEQTYQTSFYGTTSLLAKGRREFSLALGSPRFDFATDNDRYRSVLFAGQARQGISDSFTAGGVVDVSRSVVHGAIGGAWVVANSAELNAQIALSRATVLDITAPTGTSQKSGFAAQISAERASSVYRGLVRYRSLSEHYRNSADVGRELDPFRRQVRNELTVSGSLALGSYGGLSLAWVSQSLQDSNYRFREPRERTIRYDRDAFSLGYARQFAGGIGMSFTASTLRDRGPAPTRQTIAVVNVGMPIGRRGYAATNLSFSRPESPGLPGEKQKGRFDASAVLQQDIADEEGLGWRLRVASDRSANAEATYAMRSLSVYGEGSTRRESSGIRFGVAGSIATIGGRWFATRQLVDGFALVDAGEARDVRVYLNNRQVGRTDQEGFLVLPRIPSMVPHKVSLEMEDLPISANITESEKEFSVARSAGVILSLRVIDRGAARLRILNTEGEPYGEGLVAYLGGRAFAVSYAGDVLISDAERFNVLTVRRDNQQCTIRFEREPGATGVPFIGAFTCAML